MWNDSRPTWRNATKQYSCQGEGCTNVIVRGERYLDKTLREPANTHHRYCYACGETSMEYESIRRGNDFGDRYQDRIASADWKTLKHKLVSQRGNRCERCACESTTLALHHKHYKSLGQELPDDLELLCADCHKEADEKRDHNYRPKYREPSRGWIVGPNGDEWSELEEGQIYIPFDGGRYVPVKVKLAERSLKK